MSTDPSIAAALKTLRERRAAVDRAIAALEELERGTEMPAAAAQSKPRAPRRADGAGGASGARRVLHSRPGYGFSPDELAQAMLANGWKTDALDPPRAARAAANRLKADRDEHVTLERGRFYYRPPSAENLREATQGDGGTDAAA